MGTGSLSQG